MFHGIKIAAFLIVAGTLVCLADTPQRCWIYFKDKETTKYQALSRTRTQEDIAGSIGISSKALTRRAKVMPAGQLLTDLDIPVTQSYLDRLTEAGVAIINTSRWFNAVTAELTSDQVARVGALPFVAAIKPVRAFRRSDVPQTPHLSLKKSAATSITQLHDYGLSFGQLDQIKVIDIHNLRITGRGVLVGMLDDGFRWRTEQSTKHMNVIAEYDFIQHDSVTSNEPNKTPVDVNLQDQHGTITLSTVGGHYEGQLVAPAFEASFILAKTEYYPTETNIEEDNWVAGIEWEEQHGVDVVSSSLGYSEFDATDANGNPQHSYTYADMNGRTATTSKAAVIAARLGVVVCSAMGNEGLSAWHYLTSPADADSIISVGAVSSAGTIAKFSSVGPTSDGRTKPDVDAQGIDAYSANVDEDAFQGGADSLYGFFSGTSLSTPLVAGSAALILSAHPELTPIQVRDALRNSASNAASPNDTLGWGIINAFKAMLSAGMVLSTDPDVTQVIDGSTTVGVFVVSNSTVKKSSVQLMYSTNAGGSFTAVPMTLTEYVDSSKNCGEYTATIPPQAGAADVKFYVTATDSTNVARVTPYGAPSSLFDVNGELALVRGGEIPTGYTLYQNFPNPFNPATSIEYTLAKSGYTTLKVYDVLGRVVATLVDAYQAAGTHAVVRFNSYGIASGVYFYRLKSGDFEAVKKLVILK
ncbi:MAG TPA: S8 family serine peptidase [Bacteroidota bacterium]|nr:S8 family serine peptidase [Bacteroidota bacterium]